MDSVSDICKYHLLCFSTIIEVKVMSGHQVKKVKQKNSWFRAAIKVGIPNFVSGPREYIMEGEYVILAMCSWLRIR